MDRIRTAVKFQHRVPTGHAKLKPSTAGQATRHHTPVPTELRIEDALVILAPRAKEGEEPRLTLLYANGVAMVGADWQSAVSVEHDVPHQDHPGAEDSERFWFAEDSSEQRDKPLLLTMSGDLIPNPNADEDPEQPADDGDSDSASEPTE